MNRRPMILFSAAVVGAMTLLSAWAWTYLPAGAEVPVHWGLDGQVDGYAPRRSACRCGRSRHRPRRAVRGDPAI